MEKYLKRLCHSILDGKFNDENYRHKKTWHGKEIMTQPLFCSYGTIGYEVYVYDDGHHFCTIQWDVDINELTIDYENWATYINILYLGKNDVYSVGDGEFETYTNDGEDMIILLEKVRKKYLQEYIDTFDINDEVLKWWSNGENYAHEKSVPYSNIKDHYEGYESYLKWLQKVCNNMPF